MTPMKPMAPDIQIETVLKWPPGHSRKRIIERRGNPFWRATQEKYVELTGYQLTRMRVRSVLITISDNSRTDPGVAVWWSVKKQVFDYSWQDGLDLESPAPTLAEIDAAYRTKAAKCHPDRPGGGDAELFKRLAQYRKEARAWVMGSHEQHDLVLPCDHYNETRLNLAAIQFTLAAYRALDRVGIPGIMDRTLSRTLSALPSTTMDNSTEDSL
jgi:hypothetical protein